MKEFLRKRALWLVIAPLLGFIALSAWALSSPIGSSPDDNFHLASVWCGQGVQQGSCELVPGHADQRAVPAWIDNATCYAGDEDKSAGCQSDVVQSSPRLKAVSYGNFINSYPPVYYWVMHLFAGSNPSFSIIAMRLFNALLFVVIATLAFLIAPLRAKRAVLYSTIAVTVPLGLFLIPSINPSTWAITSAVALWPTLYSFAEAQGRKKLLYGIASVLFALIGVGARADAVLPIGLAIVVVAILTVRTWKMSIWNYIVPAGIVVMSSIFFLMSRQSGAVSSGLADSETASLIDPGTSKLALLIANLVGVPTIWAGIFGSPKWGLGWLDTQMPALVWFASLTVFAGLLFWGFGRKISAKTNRVRKWSALGVLIAATWGYPTYILVQTGARAGGFFQPRYVLPVIIMLFAVALLQDSASPGDTVTRQDSSPRLAQLIFIGLALASANTFALHQNIQRYITGVDVMNANLNSDVEWWWHMPLSPMVVWIVGTLAFAGVLVILLRTNPANRGPIEFARR